MKTMIALLMVLFMSSPVLAFDTVEPEEFEFSDSETYFSGEGGNSLVGLGSCAGPFLEIQNDAGKKFGGLGYTCGYLGIQTNTTGNDSAIPMLGIKLIEVPILSVTYGYAPFRNENYIGFGISVIELGDRFGGD